MFQEPVNSGDSQGGGHSSEQASTKASILLVDDHRPSLLALETVLEPLGYRLVAAESAAAALRLLASQRFTAILSDVRMPGMDGFEMLARLRSNGLATHTAVILLSAVDNDRESAQRAFESGAVDFIVKPYDADLLRCRVRALVSLCQQREPISSGPRAAPPAVASPSGESALAVAEEAERLLRSKDTFIAVLGHDLRTPLSAMQVGCRILGSDSNLTERQRSTVARLDRAVDRMSRMVVDIVDFARTAAGTSFPIRPRTTNLANVLSVVINEAGDAHPDRPIRLTVADELLVECDPDRIAQAIGNLVVNAVEHGEGEVRISADLKGDQIVVQVHNDGRPIPAESMPNLFDPFTQKPGSSTGLGLGLHVVRDIVRGHGGTIQVHSSSAQGTTFEIRWPKSRAPEGHSDQQPQFAARVRTSGL